MILANDVSGGKDMNFFTIFTQCLNSNDSATIKMAETVLHRFSIFLITEILPHRGFSMLIIRINLNFKQWVCGYLLVGVLSSWRASVDPKVSLEIPCGQLAFVVDANVATTFSMLQTHDATTEYQAIS